MLCERCGLSSYWLTVLVLYSWLPDSILVFLRKMLKAEKIPPVHHFSLKKQTKKTPTHFNLNFQPCLNLEFSISNE